MGVIANIYWQISCEPKNCLHKALNEDIKGYFESRVVRGTQDSTHTQNIKNVKFQHSIGDSYNS